MNLFKKSFIGIFILFFVLGFLYTPTPKATAGVPITVVVKINGQTTNQYVNYGQTVYLSWDSSGDDGRICTNNFGAPSAKTRAYPPGFPVTITSNKTFTVTCSNAACISGRQVFTADGSWTAPTDIRNCQVVITAIGGGAGGQGGPGSNPDSGCNSLEGGQGGGAGAIIQRKYNAGYPNSTIDAGDVVTFNVDPGGTGGAAGSSSNCTITSGLSGFASYFTVNGRTEGTATGGKKDGSSVEPHIPADILDGSFGSWTGKSSSYPTNGDGTSGATNGNGMYKDVQISNCSIVGGTGGSGGGWKQSGSDGTSAGYCGSGGGGGGAAGDVDRPCLKSCNHDGGAGGNGASGVIIIDWFGVGV